MGSGAPGRRQIGEQLMFVPGDCLCMASSGPWRAQAAMAWAVEEPSGLPRRWGVGGRPAGLSEGVRGRDGRGPGPGLVGPQGTSRAFEPAVLRHRPGIVHALSGIRALG